jgi:hypothetical protein
VQGQHVAGKRQRRRVAPASKRLPVPPHAGQAPHVRAPQPPTCCSSQTCCLRCCCAQCPAP